MTLSIIRSCVTWNKSDARLPLTYTVYVESFRLRCGCNLFFNNTIAVCRTVPANLASTSIAYPERSCKIKIFSTDVWLFLFALDASTLRMHIQVYKWGTSEYGIKLYNSWYVGYYFCQCWEIIHLFRYHREGLLAEREACGWPRSALKN